MFHLRNLDGSRNIDTMPAEVVYTMWSPHNAHPESDSLAIGKTQGAFDESKLSKTLVIKGEVTGSEPLLIDCRVEGSITASDGSVTIGRSAQVTADISAREVVIFGRVRGTVNVSDRVQIHSDASVLGDVIARRINIDDGAHLKGSVELRRDYNPKAMPSRVAARESSIGTPTMNPLRVSAR